MLLTVLGKSPSWQDAGGACSGYLIEEDDTAVLLDCGNGVFSKLHADHFLDLVPYAYALTYAPRQQPVPVDRWPGTDFPACPLLHAPPGARDLFRRVVGAWGNEDLIENAFELREYDPTEEIEIGPVRISFQPVPHFTETFAMRISAMNGSGRIVYGADCSPTDALAEFARDADLMLVEATLPRPERTGMRGHLTPEEAGDHAKGAAAKRLLLVHISDELDADRARDEAAEAFDGPVEVAREGATFDV